MPHKIGKQSYVIIFFQKVLCIAVTERVRIYYLFVKSVLLGVVFELLRDTSCRDMLAEAVKKKIARCTLLSFEPFKRFVTELLRDIQSAELATLRIKVKIASFNVFDLNAVELSRNVQSENTQNLG
jgi:hypothetical protein